MVKLVPRPKISFSIPVFTQHEEPEQKPSRNQNHCSFNQIKPVPLDPFAPTFTQLEPEHGLVLRGSDPESIAPTEIKLQLFKV